MEPHLPELRHKGQGGQGQGAVDHIHGQLDPQEEYRRDRRDPEALQDLPFPRVRDRHGQPHQAACTDGHRADRAEGLFQEGVACAVVGGFPAVEDAQDEEDHQGHQEREDGHIHVPQADLQLCV